MKNFKNLFVFAILIIALFNSCRTESVVESTIPVLQGLKANSVVASLMGRTSLLDGSNDNIIDNANCFNIDLPVTVVVNGLEIIVDSDDDFKTIEDIFNEFDDDDDNLQITFPITIILSDFTEVIINSLDEFNTFRGDCNAENEFDDDIECIDFNYPITGTIFDIVTEQSTNIIINNDEEMHQFLEDLDNDDVVSINFPISLTLSDGTNVTINDLAQLENAINDAKDNCDEDDDFDFNDDDCEGCTEAQLDIILTGCTDWTVDKLGLNNTKREDIYTGFTFNFFNDGTISIDNGTTNFTGTWSRSGANSDIKVTINIPELPDFNAVWNLHQFEEGGNSKKVDLRLSNGNRLRFKSESCN